MADEEHAAAVSTSASLASYIAKDTAREVRHDDAGPRAVALTTWRSLAIMTPDSSGSERDTKGRGDEAPYFAIILERPALEVIASRRFAFHAPRDSSGGWRKWCDR